MITQNPNLKPRYLLCGDGMPIAAVLAVLMIHVSSHGVVRFGQIPDLSWQMANLFDAFSRWAVPVFIMLSGALTLDPLRQESLSLFYGKKFKRAGIPLLFWVPAYFVWEYLYRGDRYSARELMARIAAGMPDNHLYFLFLILGLYAVTPLLKIFVTRAEKKNLAVMTGVCLFLGMLDSVAKISRYGALTKFIPYMGYYLLGYVLRSIPLDKKQTFFTAILFLTACLWTTLGTSLAYARGSSDLLALYDHLSMNVVIQSSAAFLLMSQMMPRLKDFKIVKILGSSVMGIYLIHVAVLDVVKGFTSSYFSGYPVPVMLAEVGIVFSVSALLVLIIKKIPLLKAVLGAS